MARRRVTMEDVEHAKAVLAADRARGAARGGVVMAKRKKRTVALLRCSTTQQDTAHQRRAIEEWARLRGESIDEWCEENNVSGASRKRPILGPSGINTPSEKPPAIA